MKATTHLLRGLLAVAVLALTSSITTMANNNDALPELPAPISKMSVEQWDAFSGNLQDALASGHEGLQIGAMRLSIQYAEHVNLKGSSVDLMRIYRNHSDDQVRRLAVVALGSLDSHMVTSYLRLHEPFEQSPIVRRTIRAVLAAA
ncbi:MAG: hypothetical protein KJO98_14870 [Rhodothermia bacterium]|nr:hypothetical protein [Rhodothermia bacterium]